MSRTLNVNMMISAADTANGFGDNEQPAQQTVTQNNLGMAANITSIPAAVAGTPLQGQTQKPSVIAATTAALPACTYANGASGVGATLTGNSNGALAAQDGITLVVNQLLLVKDQASGLQNGIYALTTVGDGGNPFVLTRITQMDTTGEFVDAVTYVFSGTVNGGQNWNCTNASAPTVGTTAITFAQSAAGTVISFGNLSTLGWAFLQNLDTTNFITYGPTIGGYLQKFGKLKAGESCLVRLSPGMILRALADTATCKLKTKIFED